KGKKKGKYIKNLSFRTKKDTQIDDYCDRQKEKVMIVLVYYYYRYYALAMKRLTASCINLELDFLNEVLMSSFESKLSWTKMSSKILNLPHVNSAVYVHMISGMNNKIQSAAKFSI
uniref:Uncharacterized protein n=1 Tax=Glossina palpalis gambiensis TaxID=67801 RepID=A0A1B0B4C1_9MUSC